MLVRSFHLTQLNNLPVHHRHTAMNLYENVHSTTEYVARDGDVGRAACGAVWRMNYTSIRCLLQWCYGLYR